MWSFHMKFIKRANLLNEPLASLIKLCGMSTSVRFILSYGFQTTIISPSKWTLSMRVYIVVMDVVNDITC